MQVYFQINLWLLGLSCQMSEPTLKWVDNLITDVKSGRSVTYVTIMHLLIKQDWLGSWYESTSLDSSTNFYLSCKITETTAWYKRSIRSKNCMQFCIFIQKYDFTVCLYVPRIHKRFCWTNATRSEW